MPVTRRLWVRLLFKKIRFFFDLPVSMAEEHLHTDLGTIYYLWEGDGRENEGIDILATACKKASTGVSFCYVVGGGGGVLMKFQTDYVF